MCIKSGKGLYPEGLQWLQQSLKENKVRPPLVWRPRRCPIPGGMRNLPLLRRGWRMPGTFRRSTLGKLRSRAMPRPLGGLCHLQGSDLLSMCSRALYPQYQPSRLLIPGAWISSLAAPTVLNLHLGFPLLPPSPSKKRRVIQAMTQGGHSGCPVWKASPVVGRAAGAQRWGPPSGGGLARAPLSHPLCPQIPSYVPLSQSLCHLYSLKGRML
jgi:hypothetical protein